MPRLPQNEVDSRTDYPDCQVGHPGRMISQPGICKHLKIDGLNCKQSERRSIFFVIFFFVFFFGGSLNLATKFGEPKDTKFVSPYFTGAVGATFLYSSPFATTFVYA